MSWSLDDVGALSIFGTGEMYDFSESGNNAAPWGKEITSVYISDGITKIGNNAFNGCTNVKSIKSLAIAPPTLGTNVFTGIEKKYCCVEMPRGSEKAYITNENWREIFNFCGESVVWSQSSKVNFSLTILGVGEMYDYESQRDTPWSHASLLAVNIHEGITSIGANAFNYCSSLTSLEIPKSVTSIKEKAFANNSKLERIIVLAEEPPVCGKNCFYNVGWNTQEGESTLEVPEQSIEKYKNADVWKDFYNIVTDINEISTKEKLAISVGNGNITINGVSANVQVAIYSISGAKIYQGTAKTIAIPKAGIYIVHVGNKTTKVAVR